MINLGEDWPDRMLALIEKRPESPPEASVPREGSLWVSRSSGRRGRVLWATTGSTHFLFNEEQWGELYDTEDFLRLYSEVK